jgi:DNA-binding IclR family transcriptional regulator
MISEESALAFAGSTIRSVWALELLFLLHQDSERPWLPDELIRELRSSSVVVSEALAGLQRARLVRQLDDGRYCYAASSSESSGQMVDELKRIYAERPVAVVRAIANAPNDKLRLLSDAFKFKE